jgi:hypothetical protein
VVTRKVGVDIYIGISTGPEVSRGWAGRGQHARELGVGAPEPRGGTPRGGWELGARFGGGGAPGRTKKKKVRAS